VENCFIIIINIIFFFFFSWCFSSAYFYTGTGSCIVPYIALSALYISVSLSSVHIYPCIPDKEQDAGLKTNPYFCQRDFSSAVKITALTKFGYRLCKGLDSKTDRLTVAKCVRTCLVNCVIGAMFECLWS
jgi:hypothetical protein